MPIGDVTDACRHRGVVWSVSPGSAGRGEVNDPAVDMCACARGLRVRFRLRAMRSLLHVFLILAILLPIGVATADPPATASASAAPGGRVRVVRDESGFSLTIDGQRRWLRGMGVNVTHRGLDRAARLALMRRDFEQMRAVGVDTVIGWDQPGFDRDFLDAAYASGIGVVAHFELGKTWDYADPALRERLRASIARWVARYAAHPAVLMWGIGNEVLLTSSDEECRAFAEFFVEAYTLVRQLDSTRPVLYREAEDVRVRYFRDAFAAADLAPEQFIFGMNFYTPRIAEVLDGWTDHAFDVPVIISEYAPAGLSPRGRPRGFQALWEIIRARDDLVLGAAPYVWSTNGPEAVDEIFGLTDPTGHAVDGSLEILQRLYRGKEADPSLLPGIAPRWSRPHEHDIATASGILLERAIASQLLDPVDLDEVRRRAEGVYRAQIEAAPGFAFADAVRVERMLRILIDTAALAALTIEGQPVYSGAVEALPLLAGMARWTLVDPTAQDVGEAFIATVLDQALAAPRPVSSRR